jgi:hypothetical protein
MLGNVAKMLTTKQLGASPKKENEQCGMQPLLLSAS